MKYFKTKFKIECSAANDDNTVSTARELCAALAGYAGYESFEDTNYGIDGYVQQENFSETELTAMLTDFPLEGVTVSTQTEEADDRNWNETWENEGFEPIVIGERCIIHDSHHAAAAPYPIDIEIDAKQAFGTGTHNTTRMIVGRLLDTDLKGKHVLDCGCGTGILSIVASKCGAAQVVGYDIDEWSVENTRHNAQKNGVDNVEAVQGDVTAVEKLEGKFDMVLANINRNILLHDMPYWVRVMAQGCTFIISGFYSEDVPMLRDAAAALGLEYQDMQCSDNWTMLVFKKN